MRRRAVLPVFVALGLVAALLLPPPPGLSPAGRAALAVTVAAVVLWSTDALPSGAVALASAVALTLSGAVANLGAALGGFARPTVFFLLGVLALGAATLRSGLAERAADLLLRAAAGRGARLYAQMVAGFALLAFLLPSASTRGAIMLPVYEQALARFGAPPHGRLHRATMLGLASLNRLGSNGILTGGVTPVVAAGLIGGFTWTSWLVFMGPPVYALLILGGLAVYLMERPDLEPAPVAAERPPIIAGAAPLTPCERRTLAVAALTSVLWMLDWLHHWDPAIPALLGVALLVVPGRGATPWRDLERGLGWANLLVVGASLSLADAMVRSGAADWLADGLRTWALPPIAHSALLPVGLIVGCLVIRAVLPNISAYLTLLIPIAMALAPDLGLNPLVCAMLVTVAGDSVLYYTAQSSSSLIVSERGHLGQGPVFRLALVMSVLILVVLLLLAIPYWSALGQPLA